MTGFFEGQGEGAQVVPHNIDAHTDVTITVETLIDKDVLTYNIGTEQWINAQPEAVVVPTVAMDDLTDVEAPTPLDGQAITWVDANGRYEPVNIAAGAPINLNDILDVTLTAPTNGDRLEYTGGNWVNVTGSTTTNNPVTIGDGADITNAGLILDAGSLAGDIASVSFSQNNVEVYNINLENNGIEPVLKIADMMAFGTDGAFVDQDFHVTGGKSLVVNNAGDTLFGAIDINASNGMDINPPPTSKVNIGGEFFVYTDAGHGDLRFSVDTDGDGHFAGKCDSLGTMSCASLSTYSGGINSAAQVKISSTLPTNPNHATRKDYVDSGLSGKVNQDGTGGVTGDLGVNGTLSALIINTALGNITSASQCESNAPTPTQAQHLTRKDYVDSAMAAMQLQVNALVLRANVLEAQVVLLGGTI